VTKKIGGQLVPLAHSLFFFSKSPDENFETAILLSIIEMFNNYVFEEDLIPHSARGKGVPIVYT